MSTSVTNEPRLLALTCTWCFRATQRMYVFVCLAGTNSYVVFTRRYRPADGPGLCPVFIVVSGVCPLYVRGMSDVGPPDGERRTQRRTVRRTVRWTVRRTVPSWEHHISDLKWSQCDCSSFMSAPLHKPCVVKQAPVSSPCRPLTNKMNAVGKSRCIVLTATDLTMLSISMERSLSCRVIQKGDLSATDVSSTHSIRTRTRLSNTIIRCYNDDHYNDSRQNKDLQTKWKQNNPTQFSWERERERELHCSTPEGYMCQLLCETY